MKKEDVGVPAPKSDIVYLNNQMDVIGHKGFSDSAVVAVVRWMIGRA
jgi:hypothetical protein